MRFKIDSEIDSINGDRTFLRMNLMDSKDLLG